MDKKIDYNGDEYRIGYIAKAYGVGLDCRGKEYKVGSGEKNIE